MRVLILGGTAEARSLADHLVDRGIWVMSSLAGRVSRPRLPVGEVRIGGFGGVDGLVDYLHHNNITHLVDATHPFATTMTDHAVTAAATSDVDLIRLARPGWSHHRLADTWTWAATLDEARQAAEKLGDKPFLTTGRQTLPHFLSDWSERQVLVRVVEPLTDPTPAGWTVLIDRGPYEVDAEKDVMRRHDIDVLLTKDSGGSYTAAKLTAAAELDIPVVVVSRPPTAPTVTAVESVAKVLTHLGCST